MRTTIVAAVLAAALAACGGGDGGGGAAGGIGGFGGTGGNGGTGGTGGTTAPCADADDDGVCDDEDACPGGDDAADADGDGVPDACDNCPDVPNADQADTDGVRAAPIDYVPLDDGPGVVTIDATDEMALSSGFPIGFSFPFFGETHDTFWVNTGLVAFSWEDAIGTWPTDGIPYADDGNGLIAAGFARWQFLPTSRFTYEVRGEAPERQLVVAFRGWARTGGRAADFGAPAEPEALVDTWIVLHEDGAIETHTNAPLPPEETAGLIGAGFDPRLMTRGVESPDGHLAALLPGESAAPLDLRESAVRFTTGLAPDGVGDACANRCPDADGDGVCDAADACPGDDRADWDGDGTPDGCDACPFDEANDADGDGVCGDEDRCEGFDDAVDEDGDTIPDGCDGCPGADDRADVDFDGVADACDACIGNDASGDTDGDGVCDGNDVCEGSDLDPLFCTWLAYRGGAGGGAVGPFECPDDTTSVGIETAPLGGVVGGVRLVCADAGGAEVARPGQFGGDVHDDTERRELRCDDAGGRMVGAFGRTGMYLYDVGVVCADAAGARWTVAGGPVAPAAIDFGDLCPIDGWGVRALQMRLGSWVDGLQLGCGPIAAP